MDGMNTLSASDIALLNNGGMGGTNSLFWIFALLILAGGGFGGFGYGRNVGDFGQYATAASQQEILFGQRFQNIDNKIDRLGNGIADATYALNNSISSEGRQLQSKLADCCCSNKEATAQVRYDMANFASAINSNIDNKFAALEKNQLQAQLAEQAQRINDLTLQAQLAGVVRYPMNSSWAMAGNPFCNCGNGCCGM